MNIFTIGFTKKSAEKFFELLSKAGVKRIVLCTPSINGKLNGAVYYAASKIGISEYYSLGGASAVMALAMGTSKVKSTVKIVGPGSNFVSLAKKLVFLDKDPGFRSINYLLDDLLLDIVRLIRIKEEKEIEALEDEYVKKLTELNSELEEMNY